MAICAFQGLEGALKDIISIRNQLGAAFTWDSTEQGMEYWKEVSNNLFAMERQIERQLQTTHVKLTGDYTAEILKEDKMVKVGCQKIPFDRIEELYKAMRE